MKSLLPDLALPAQNMVDAVSTARLRASHQCRQRAVAQFDEPMKMIRHHHPSHRMSGTFFLGESELVYHQPPQAPICKQRATSMNDGGE
jgi:hypothetical protein